MPTVHNLRYRPDIDGLRAIAVLAVLLFHAHIPQISGGFIGVDVFFVISGYLITAALLSDGSILRFYRHRARRILPALFVLIAVVGIAAGFILLPRDLVEFGKSAIAALTFWSNILFWRQSGYFASETELKPLLHTWSLGVEEQFYIVFPLILWMACRLSREKLAILLAALAAASLALAVFAISQGKTTAAFYLAPTRAWELLVGSLLATGMLPTPDHRGLRTGVAAMGLVAILVPLFLYTGHTPFPGLAALAPVLGSMALIWAGTGGRHGLSPLMEFRPLVFIGLISYSLYLWHWPLLAFLRYLTIDEPSTLQITIALALALVIAAGSWRFVEQPFRRPMPDRQIWSFAGGGLVALSAVFLAVIATKGLPSRFSPRIVALNAENGSTYRCPLVTLIPFDGYYACPIGPSSDYRNADVVLWGDSHAQMYVPAVKGALAGKSGILVNVYGCAPMIGFNADATCARLQEANLGRILKLKAKTVILAMSWKQYRDAPLIDRNGRKTTSRHYAIAMRQLRETADRLVAAGKRVILVSPIAIPGYNVGSVLSREIQFYGKPLHPTEIPARDFERESTIILDGYAAAMAAHPQIRVVRVDKALCADGSCKFATANETYFSDYGHLTSGYAATLAPLFAAQM